MPSRFSRGGSAVFRVRAPAKINLCLRIVGRRVDGYHSLDSYVVPISLFDELSLRVEASSEPHVTFRSNLRRLDAATDLTVRAAHLFMRRTGKPLRVAIRLLKHIPIGAGLGGGSSDAAAALHCLAAASRPIVSRRRLRGWSLELGADVPFFVEGRPARIRGIGELVSPLRTVPPWALVLAFPGVGLSTAEVYRAYDRSLTKKQGKSSIRASALARVPPAEILMNDLETAATRLFPEIHALKVRLEELGAVSALMTGSGSAVFGIWNEKRGARTAAQRLNHDGVWARAVEILERCPAVEKA